MLKTKTLASIRRAREFCTFKNGCFVIWVHKGYEYEIELERCNDKDKFLEWICHLSEKIWFDNNRLYDFQQCFQRITGIDLRKRIV